MLLNYGCAGVRLANTRSAKCSVSAGEGGLDGCGSIA